MARAALIASLLAAALLALPLALRVPLIVAGPFTGPLGGGLAVVALVLGGWAWRVRRTQGARPGVARAAVVLGAAAVASSLAVEWALVTQDAGRPAAPAGTASQPQTP